MRDLNFSDRSKEDVYRSFQPDFRVGQPIWEGTDRGISERHLQAQPGYGDANCQMEINSFYVDELST